MIAKKVSYFHFRNIEKESVELSEGVNVFLGNNAEGKTNALEGLYLMAAGKSFRTPREREMVSFGKDFFEIGLTMEDARREKELSFKAFSEESGKRRILQKNGVTISRISEFIGNFRAVLFCPEHLAIVKAGPSERRNFLDIALCQLRPLYLASLQRFQKILKQRNILLKQLSDGNGDRTLLSVYSEQLARESAFLYKMRREYVNRLDQTVKALFEKMTENEMPSLVYQTSLKLSPGEEPGEIEAFELYKKRLEANVDREIAAGTTLYGSHKDDVEIFLNGKEARLFASQGQQRSLALAMKLGEGEIARDYAGEYPVFLLDDVLSELDPGRQKFLLSEILERQVIMTVCTPPAVMSEAAFFEVKNGTYRKL